MPVSLQQVKDRVLEEFQGASVDLLEEDQYHRINGMVVWPGFANKSSKQRSDEIRDKVRHAFGLDGLNIGIILAVTPEEARVA